MVPCTSGRGPVVINIPVPGRERLSTSKMTVTLPFQDQEPLLYPGRITGPSPDGGSTRPLYEAGLHALNLHFDVEFDPRLLRRRPVNGGNPVTVTPRHLLPYPRPQSHEPKLRTRSHLVVQWSDTESQKFKVLPP